MLHSGHVGHGSISFLTISGFLCRLRRERRVLDISSFSSRARRLPKALDLTSWFNKNSGPSFVMLPAAHLNIVNRLVPVICLKFAPSLIHFKANSGL